ncbi:alpha/beta hydrolase family protein [Kocuria rosea]|uniref:alpha/beta hydrolase family protein n=1 Tax=Kocuria rosea TaxID=1275 RepID=UPI000F6FC276|nr:hypothetical protein [Kocuria rosea]VEI50377.1 Uncharacterised protein [Kocuria rosea]
MSETITLPLNELSKFDAGDLIPDRPHRIDVVTGQTVLPFLVVPRAGADSLLVISNGAVDHTVAQGHPVFQRSSWSREIRHHQVYFCDPGTVGIGHLSLAWGQVSREYSAVHDAAHAVRVVASGLRVADPGRRVYYGSSAGGFLALALLSDDEGASAILNNAQFDWTRWMATGLNPLRQARFANMLPLDLRRRYPLRTNVLNLLVKRDRPVRIDYHVNLASKHDRDIDHPMFEEFVHSHPSLTRNVQVLPYDDVEAGHNPLPKGRTIELLNDSFPHSLLRSPNP